MGKLVDLAWGREVHMGLEDFNEELMKGNDVVDQLTPIVKLPQTCEYAQLLSNLIVEHSSSFEL